MTDKVVTMDGARLPAAPESSEDCVKMLEAWLDMARSGEVVSIAIAGTCGGGAGLYGISHYVENVACLLGQIEYTKRHLLSDE